MADIDSIQTPLARLSELHNGGKVIETAGYAIGMIDALARTAEERASQVGVDEWAQRNAYRSAVRQIIEICRVVTTVALPQSDEAGGDR